MYGSNRSIGSAVSAACVVLGLTALSLSAAAQSGPSASDEQVRRLRTQVRQLQQEQTGLQEARAKAEAARAALQQELESIKADLSRQKASAGAASNKATAFSKDLASVRAEKEVLAEKLIEVENALKTKSDQHAICQRDLQVTQRDMGATNLGLGEANARLGSSLKQCVTFNHELHGIGTDLLQRYEKKGFGEVLGVNEPFIQRARVRLENVSQEIKDKLEARNLAADQ